MDAYKIHVQTDTRGIMQFLVHADSKDEIRQTLGKEINVVKFLKWMGFVNPKTNKLIADEENNYAKSLGRITQMRLNNITDFNWDDEDWPSIKDYDPDSQEEITLDQIYDIDWMSAML
jgi:hypothetical protein